MFRKLVSFFSGNDIKRQSKLTYAHEKKSNSVRKKPSFDLIGKGSSVLSHFKRVPVSLPFSWTSLFGPRLWKVLVAVLVLSVPLAFLSKAFLLVSLHGIAALSRIYYRWFPVSLGVELGTFVVVLTAISHGPVAGMFIGILHFLVSRAITREPWNIVPICLVGYVTMGFLAGILPWNTFPSLVMFGLVITLSYDLMTSPFFVVFLGYSFWRELIFIITHILFNYWIFSTFGEWGLRLVGVA